MALNDHFPQGVELVSFKEGLDGWNSWQFAIDGVLSVPFDVHDTYREQFRSEASFAAYLLRQAQLCITRYGDGRDPRPEPEEGLSPEQLSYVT
jgi:hypothetical protein